MPGKRVTVYLPAELYDRAMAELPETEAWSGIFREAMLARLGCSHDMVRRVCRTCGSTLSEEGATGGSHP